MPQHDRLVWIDLEMTGLSTESDEIVEIAAIVTEADLTEIDPGVSFVIKPGDKALTHMDDFVTNMHTESGLITEIPNGLSLADAQDKVLTYIKEHIPRKERDNLPAPACTLTADSSQSTCPTLTGTCITG